MVLLERPPFWVFFVLGALLIAGASVQYIGGKGALGVENGWIAPPAPPPADVVFLENFNENEHVSAIGDVYLLGQIDPFTATALPLGPDAQAQIYGFFKASSRKGDRQIEAVVIAKDDQAFKTWMAENPAGNASKGDLFAIHGRVTHKHEFVAPAVDWISGQGFETSAHFVVILPYTAPYAPPPPPQRLGRILPVALMLLGGICLVLGAKRYEQRRIQSAKPKGHGVAILNGLDR